jgi:hypothetical protein
MNEIQAPNSPAFLKPQFHNIPQKLRLLDRFVAWKFEPRKPGEEPGKIPYTPGRKNKRASSTNPATWGTFAQAEAAYLAGGVSGIGIVLNGDGLVGVDIDHCVGDGVPSEKAMALLDKLGAAYIEISPSGTGLRAIGYGEQLDAGVNGTLNGLKAEFYSTGRYLTLTGKTIKSGPIAVLKDFKTTADSFRAAKAAKLNQEAGQIENVSTCEKQHSLVQRLLCGEVYHDSLRDLAASWVAQGMAPAAAIATLEALMDSATQRAEWKARRDQIPDLVNSAYAKYQVRDFSDQLKNAAADTQHYRLLSSDDLHALPPLSWCVRGVLPSVGLAALYGPSGSGKSFLALDMAAAIAEGTRWFDCRVVARPVVYCALEGESGFKLRVQAWEKHNARSLPAELRMVLQSVTLTNPQNVKDLAAVVPPGAVIVFDTLNRAAPTADENSSKDMGQILEAAKALQRKVGGLVLLIHHTGKNEDAGARGHSSFFAALDAAVKTSRRGDRRVWKIDKAKDGKDGGEQAFTLDVVLMGLDEYGDSIDSCVVVPTGTTAARHPKPLTASQRMGLDSLTTALADDLFGSSVDREAWRDHFYSRHTAEKIDTKRTAFARVTCDLLALGLVCEAKGMFSIPDF